MLVNVQNFTLHLFITFVSNYGYALRTVYNCNQPDKCRYCLCCYSYDIKKESGICEVAGL
jgi:hypothetical protein